MYKKFISLISLRLPNAMDRVFQTFHRAIIYDMNLSPHVLTACSPHTPFRPTYPAPGWNKKEPDSSRRRDRRVVVPFGDGELAVEGKASPATIDFLALESSKSCTKRAYEGTLSDAEPAQSPGITSLARAKARLWRQATGSGVGQGLCAGRGGILIVLY